MSAEDVVAWQMRTIDDPEGPGMWQHCSADNAKFLSQPTYRDAWEVRALVTLTASQARYERLRGMVEGLAGKYDASMCHAYQLANELKSALLADGGEANDNEVEG